MATNGVLVVRENLETATTARAIFTPVVMGSFVRSTGKLLRTFTEIVDNCSLA